ncbi:ADP,ATP carrier protein 1 [Rickettsia prowazekii str. Breinl]|nr:ADP,ATP carrier protein 1 [Rickettsia prowazekii str. Breinl]EOB09511.1 hypothetical protein H377_8160 [Rickettsia prowazekii str. Cairo 3]EOB10126.1 hypothetical protein H376_2730 [Rickettsia prowazekii str. GvF12]
MQNIFACIFCTISNSSLLHLMITLVCKFGVFMGVGYFYSYK